MFSQRELRSEKKAAQLAKKAEIEHNKSRAERASRRKWAAAAPLESASGPVAAVAAVPETPVYIMLGHGYEDKIPMSERPTLPEGYTLVTTVEYGGYAFMDEVCKSIKLFTNSDNREMLTNPANFVNEISDAIYTEEDRTKRRYIHIYNSGDKIPALNLSPVADWANFKDKYTTFLASGVRPFPMAPTAGRKFLGRTAEGGELQTKITSASTYDINSQLCDPFLYYRHTDTIDDELLDRIYAGSLYPTRANAQRFVGRPLKELKDGLKKPILEVLGGPGIYYFVVCRDTQENLAVQCDNFFRFTFSKDERESGDEDYIREMARFRGNYILLRDPVEKMRYFLSILRGEGGEDGISDDTFKKALPLLFVGEENIPSSYFVDGNRANLLRRVALEEDKDYYLEVRRMVTTASRIRSGSNVAQSEAAPMARRTRGGAWSKRYTRRI